MVIEKENKANKRMIALEISNNEDEMLKSISSFMKLNNPNYNRSAVIRRCIKETHDGIIQTK